MASKLSLILHLESFEYDLRDCAMKKNEISILNVLFCLMIIFIHVTAAPITNLSPDTLIVKVLFVIHRICGVAVHGFVFLSGLKLFLKDTSNIKYYDYIVSRIKRIYIPYLIVAVLYYFFEVCRGVYIFDIHQLAGFLTFGNGEAHLYFVFVIMQFYLLLPLWRHLVNTKNTPVLLIVAALINIVGYCYLTDILSCLNIAENFSYNHGLFTSYIFVWTLGCVCGKYYDKFVNFIGDKKFIFGLVAGLLTFADVYMEFNNFYYGGVFEFSKIVRLLYLPAMIMFVYSLFAGCKLKIFNNRILKLIDGASFEIYLFHIFVIYVVGSFTKKIALGQLELYSINFVFVYLISITLCVLYKNIIGRLKK